MDTAQYEPEADAPAIETPFEDWPYDKAALAKEQILSLMEHPGWEFLSEAIEAQSAQINRALVNRTKPAESPAEYEARLGEVRGLQMIYRLADGMILAGTEAERMEKAPDGSQ